MTDYPVPTKQRALEALDWMAECTAMQDSYRAPEAYQAVRRYIEHAKNGERANNDRHQE